MNFCMQMGDSVSNVKIPSVCIRATKDWSCKDRTESFPAKLEELERTSRSKVLNRLLSFNIIFVRFNFYTVLFPAISFQREIFENYADWIHKIACIAANQQTLWNFRFKILFIGSWNLASLYSASRSICMRKFITLSRS